MDSKIKIILSVFLFLLTITINAQDKKVMKIAKYIEKGKGTEAKELLDELDSKKEYQSDIYYWYVRTVYYRNAALSNTDSPPELAEARKSFEKLVEFDKTDPSKSFTQYIPQIKKELYEGQNQITKSGSSSQSGGVNQANDNGKTVTLTQIGQGKTKDAAKYNALRNAIEKAFGTFISSNTTLLNDELVKDEIVSFSTGNIQDYEILSETQMPDGSFSSVVKATVSIGKLTTFCESKGIAVEFKGGLFATNLKMINLYKENEERVMANLFDIVKPLLNKSFDYSVIINTPQKGADNVFGGSDPIKMENMRNGIVLWSVPITVTASSNNNFRSICELIKNTIDGVKMSYEEVSNYKVIGMESWWDKIDGKKTYFRSFYSIGILEAIFYYHLPLSSYCFTIDNGINLTSWKDIIESSTELDGGRAGLVSRKLILKNGYSPPHMRPEVGVNYSIVLEESNGELFADHEGIQRIINTYGRLGSGKRNVDCLNLDLRTILSKNVSFSFPIINFLNESDLSKITEYKVQPIMK